MKMGKKHWIIVGVVIVIILVWYFFLKKKGILKTTNKCCGWDKDGKCTTQCDPKTGAAPTTAPESGYMNNAFIKRNVLAKSNQVPQQISGYNCHGYSQGHPVIIPGPCSNANANNGWTTIFTP